jgi:tetratricopeptide (TPR) repeat protein
MHGRLAVARGEPTRGIALLTRALRQADRAHDARCIGLARYELGLCYRRVGEAAIVREHLAQAASALHAAGDRRSLAMVHSLSGILFAQEGRLDEAMSALRQGERLAVTAGADDVVATICGNQANVALMQHRHEQALALAERSVALQEAAGTPHGLGVALASLGQICVRVGNLARAEETLNRALDVRSPLQFMRETTGAVFDTLAQIHLIRGEHDQASYSLQKAREAYGETLASRWYQWSIRTLEARLALRRGDPEEALDTATQVARAEGAPAGYLLQAELIAIEALLALSRIDEARVRLEVVAAQVRPDGLSGT